MSIHTKQSASGFIASDPQLTYGKEGVPRFYARFGQEHYRREENGTYTQLEPTFHNLVMYRKTAEWAMQHFVNGDRFIAGGYTHEYTYEKDGQQRGGEEFVATTIGHDGPRSRYTVDRTPRPDRALDRDSPAVDRGQAFTAPDRAATAPEPAAIAR
ncbi:MAG: single-stranded DNA-binding protein [Leifsonia sp.]